MKKTFFSRVCNVSATALMLLGGLFTFNSCFDSDDVGDAYYTFTGKTVASFIEETESLKEFCHVLDTTGIINLLSTYGNFTCFAPTNEAMKAYYADSGATDLKSFLSARPDRMDILKDMVYFQLIDKASYLTSQFPEGRLEERNMKARYIEVSFKNLATTGNILVNGDAEIVLKDQEVHNGVIHGTNRVMVPSNFFLPEMVAGEERFSIFSQALYLTGLSEKLLQFKDESYKRPASFVDQNGKSINSSNIPDERLFFYTALAESDELYLNKGIVTDTSNIEKCMDELRAYAAKVYDPRYPQYADISDPTDPNNSLNRFMAYHIFDHMAYENEFLYDVSYLHAGEIHDAATEGYDHDVNDFIEPMAPYSLIEVRERPVRIDNGDGAIYTAYRPAFNVKSDGSFVPLLSMVSVCLNGMLYEIGDVLVFDEAVVNDVLNKRLRIDVYATMPEMMNIGKRTIQNTGRNTYYPQGFFKNLTYNDEKTKVCQTDPHNGGVQHQGCMFYIYGWYDFTYNLPPIPEGTWEFRLGIKTRASSILQIYVDGRPNGIPLDMKKKADHPDIGWIVESSLLLEDGVTRDEEAIAQNDKDLRNRGWMKGPASFHAYPSGSAAKPNSRYDMNTMRRIIGRYEFADGIQHTLRIKAVGMGDGSDGDPYFGFDYVEFIPTSMIEDEDRY